MLSRTGRKIFLIFLKKGIDIWRTMQYTNIRSAGDTSECGGIAQLGERLNGIQEVSGSIPLISTKRPETGWFQVSFYRFSQKMAKFKYPAKATQIR